MLKVKNWEFSQIPNQMFCFGDSNVFCGDDEIRLYAYLQFVVSRIGMVITVPEIIINDLDWRTSKKSNDKKRVERVLESLRAKKYIEFELNEGIYYITILEIDTTKEYFSTFGERSMKFSGFTKVSDKEFNDAESKYDITILCYVKWRENLKNISGFEYKISFEEWANILDVSTRQAQNLVNACQLITKKSGAFSQDTNNLIKQEPNSYSINGFPKLEDDVVIAETKVSANKNEFKIRTTFMDVKAEDDSIEEETFKRIWSKDKYLVVEDISTIINTTSAKLQVIATNKFKAMIKNEKSKYALKKLFDEAMGNKKAFEEMEGNLEVGEINFIGLRKYLIKQEVENEEQKTNLKLEYIFDNEPSKGIQGLSRVKGETTLDRLWSDKDFDDENWLFD